MITQPRKLLVQDIDGFSDTCFVTEDALFSAFFGACPVGMFKTEFRLITKPSEKEIMPVETIEDRLCDELA